MTENPPKLIRDLFASDVTRDIPPVVYFHEQSRQKLADEVGEYIITGGWPEGHPHHRRVPNGIHEQYVRLLTGIAGELEKPKGIELLPSAWISGFYGSGKSSFAKLLGLALDGRTLPDGTPLSEALLRRDTSPRAAEFRDAWTRLRGLVEPIAVVFDIGGVARGDEPIHGAIMRQVQQRLGYCPDDEHVADFELRLEREDLWARFEEAALQTLGKPWSQANTGSLAADDFSFVMSVLFPEKYTDPMAWYTARAGTHVRGGSAEEATRAIGDMLKFRAPGRTLFMVVDEVSQYIHQDTQRMLALQSFVAELQQRLKGKAWLLVTGQEKLDEAGDQVVLGKMKDRFPPRFRVHLAQTNIFDVVHKRLLRKKPEHEAALRALYTRHRQDLNLYAYDGQNITEDEFVDVYPMLPGHIDLILQITTALRTRSTRAQGDDQAIRGLLQLLGELFRDRKLADRPVGSLVTLDDVYEVQQTALDSDVQGSMARVLARCADDASGLLVRCAKVVALLELLQETMPTTAELVARCLYERIDLGNRRDEVEKALETLRARNLLGFSEKLGYKLQSSAGEEWERERREIGVPREQLSEQVREELKYLLADPEQPKLQGRPFPWGGRYSDGRAADDVQLVAPRDEAAFVVDFRFLPRGEQIEETWIKRSDETNLRDRLVWVSGDVDQLESLARELVRSEAMVRKYEPRRESLTPARKVLLVQEINRAEELKREVRTAIDAAWTGGRMYFRGRPIAPRDHGSSFGQAVVAVATRLLPDLFPHFTPTQVDPRELTQLLGDELTGPSAKFLGGDLGILELDAGRYVPSCNGVVPRRVAEFIEGQRGVSGGILLSQFGKPPYGYTPNVVRACVAGLLRAGKVRIQPDGGPEITAIRDAGTRDVFEKDRSFRQATFLPPETVGDTPTPTDRARICKFFKDHLGHDMDREDHVIADAVAKYFPALVTRLRDVLVRLNRVAPEKAVPPRLEQLQHALEACLRHVRLTKPTVLTTRDQLPTLREGVVVLNTYDAELTEQAIDAVRAARTVRDHQAAQLLAEDDTAAELRAAAEHIAAHLRLDKPWSEIAVIDPDLALVRSSYRDARRRILARQEAEAENVRARVKARAGFEKLNADEAHHVLRPIAEAVTNTTDEAIAPSLRGLRDEFRIALPQAEETANDRLDEILGKKIIGPPMKRVALKLQHRELETEADLEALLDEVRKRLQPLLKDGARVRLV